MSARHVLVVADSCFSGSLTRGALGQPPASKDRFFAELDGKFSRKVITSGGTQPVADAGSGGHSIFAFYFLKALRENNAPYLTSFELYNGFVRAVANNAEQKPEYGTIVMAGDEGAGDFTFALRNWQSGVLNLRPVAEIGPAFGGITALSSAKRAMPVFESLRFTSAR